MRVHWEACTCGSVSRWRDGVSLAREVNARDRRAIPMVGRPSDLLGPCMVLGLRFARLPVFYDSGSARLLERRATRAPDETYY
eukprot:SAG11_NODE_359_length_10228_cov_7.861388_2_plen_83_part_00